MLWPLSASKARSPDPTEPSRSDTQCLCDPRQVPLPLWALPPLTPEKWQSVSASCPGPNRDRCPDAGSTCGTGCVARALPLCWFPRKQISVCARSHRIVKTPLLSSCARPLREQLHTQGNTGTCMRARCTLAHGPPPHPPASREAVLTVDVRVQLPAARLPLLASPAPLGLGRPPC